MLLARVLCFSIFRVCLRDVGFGLPVFDFLLSVRVILENLS